MKVALCKRDMNLVLLQLKILVKQRKQQNQNGYWVIKKTHKDNLDSLEIISDADNCEVIKNIDDWEIDLTLEVGINKETNSSDWFGYMRID